MSGQMEVRKAGDIDVCWDGYRFYLRDPDNLTSWSSCMEHKHDEAPDADRLAQFFWDSLKPRPSSGGKGE
jgi:hypothetical protein